MEQNRLWSVGVCFCVWSISLNVYQGSLCPAPCSLQVLVSWQHFLCDWLLPLCRLLTRPPWDCPVLSGLIWSSAGHLRGKAGWPCSVLVSPGAASHEWPVLPGVRLCLFCPHFLSLGHHAKCPEVQEIVGVCIYVCMWRKNNSWKWEAVVEGAMAGIAACVPLTGMRLVGCAVADTWDEAQRAIAESMGSSSG